ncbi:hypothetical protein BC939DRAFT_218281 [Gamsiella multidivaricata]|uniref:uncharacterized protein n=1 Tax=Gamsiella multidivaricata TaxID=101098 RepID=UPI002220657F|nr:uncharacterized protein BC939DRAFT_218281 [Gamsiella multidivaricata]KAI7820828.1 hypothetical protein BC939DRAFT_218281 [Gamsiella multidivaricata]
MLLKISTVSALLLAASSAVAFPSFIQSERLAPVISSVEAEVVPDSYFVVFKDGVRAYDQAAWVSDLHHQDLMMNGAWDDGFDESMINGVNHLYDMGSFQGLAGRFRPEVLDEIRRNPDVSALPCGTLLVHLVRFSLLGS